MKRTRMLLPRTVARLIFYAFICKYVYSESSIITTILIAYIIIENIRYQEILPEYTNLILETEF